MECARLHVWLTVRIMFNRPLVSGAHKVHKHSRCSALLDDSGCKILLFPATVGLRQRTHAMIADRSHVALVATEQTPTHSILKERGN